MKKLLSALISVIIICISVTSAAAFDYGCDVEPVSESVYMEELNTGAVVFDYHAEEKAYPASTTKVMTYIIVTENVADLDNTMVEISEEALADLDPESSVMGLTSHIGESYSVRDLLYGLMLPSGNDAALVLAEYVGQSVEGFVSLMNNKAAQLGCENTHFTSPHGLHDSQHYSTAKDMAVITKYAMQKKDFMEICNTKSYTPDGFYEPIKTTNFMIDESQHNGDYYYPYAKGIKTGYTDEAGRCLISTAEKDGYRYLCIALGADYSFIEDVNYAMLDTAKLYDWAFDSLAYRAVYDSSDTLKSISVDNLLESKTLDLVPADEVKALLPADYDQKLVSIQFSDSVEKASAPVTKGDKFGTLTVYYDNVPIGTTDMVAAEDIAEESAFGRILIFIRDNIIWIVIIIVVLILFLVILISSIKRKKARRNRHRSRIRRD